MQRFIDCCQMSMFNHDRRYNAVKAQYQRHAWEVDDKMGRIRICNYKGEAPYIIVFHSIIAMQEHKYDNGTEQIELTVEDYEKLEKEYFNGWKPDYEYLTYMNRMLNK